MTGAKSPRRFYIDHDGRQDEPIVRAVSVQRSSRPATHQVEPLGTNTTSHRLSPLSPRINKLVQSAIRRRTS